MGLLHNGICATGRSCRRSALREAGGASCDSEIVYIQNSGQNKRAAPLTRSSVLWKVGATRLCTDLNHRPIYRNCILVITIKHQCTSGTPPFWNKSSTNSHHTDYKEGLINQRAEICCVSISSYNRVYNDIFCVVYFGKNQSCYNGLCCILLPFITPGLIEIKPITCDCE